MLRCPTKKPWSQRMSVYSTRTTWSATLEAGFVQVEATGSDGPRKRVTLIPWRRRQSLGSLN